MSHYFLPGKSHAKLTSRARCWSRAPAHPDGSRARLTEPGLRGRVTRAVRVTRDSGPDQDPSGSALLRDRSGGSHPDPEGVRLVPGGLPKRIHSQGKS